jgi:GlpG protein
MVDVRSEIFARSPSRQMPVTIALIALSILATLASGLPGLSGLTRLLYFSEYLGGNFPEIVHGQIWRLVTPIFLHGGIWHLLFNMMWIYQLGGAMEIHEGSRFLLLFTVLISILVNSAEYLATGPLFIGMSGVVYAMLGYAWIMSRHQYNSPYELGPGTTFIMMAWLVLCLVGVIPGVANTQHVIGLLLGGLLGLYRSRYISNWLRQSRRK